MSKRVFGELLGRLEDHLNLVGDYEAEGPIKGADGVLRTHNKLPARNLETRFGTVRIWRKGYGGTGVSTLVPADGKLNLPQEKFSHPLQHLVCEEISKSSYEETLPSVERYTAGHVARAQVQDIAEHGSQDFDAFYEQRQEAAKTQTWSEQQEPAESLLVLTTDGKGNGYGRRSRKTPAKCSRKCSRRDSVGTRTERSSGWRWSTGTSIN